MAAFEKIQHIQVFMPADVRACVLAAGFFVGIFLKKDQHDSEKDQHGCEKDQHASDGHKSAVAESA